MKSVLLSVTVLTMAIVAASVLAQPPASQVESTPAKLVSDKPVANSEANSKKIDLLAEFCACPIFPVYTDPNDPNNVLYYYEIRTSAMNCNFYDVAYGWSLPVYAPADCLTTGNTGACKNCDNFAFLEFLSDPFAGMDRKQGADCTPKFLFPHRVKHPQDNSQSSKPRDGIVRETAFFAVYENSGSNVDTVTRTYLKCFNVEYDPNLTNYPRHDGDPVAKKGVLNICYEINPDLNGNGNVEDMEIDVLQPLTVIKELLPASRKETVKDADGRELLDQGKFVRKFTHRNGTKYLVLLARTQKP